MMPNNVESEKDEDRSHRGTAPKRGDTEDMDRMEGTFEPETSEKDERCEPGGEGREEDEEEEDEKPRQSG